jgi:hypothetical protein
MLKVERQQESEEDQLEEATPAVVPEKRERRQSAVSETSATGKNSASAKEEIKKEVAKETEEPGEETEKYFSQLEFKDLPLSE